MKNSLVFIVILGLMMGQVLAQDKSEEEKIAQEKWAKFVALGEHHNLFKDFEGYWEVEGKFWMAPNAPAHEFKGESHFSIIWGGRYLTEENKSESMVPGQVFEGRGVTGYDNALQKYTSAWFDTMGTGIMMSIGTYDETTKLFTMIGEFLDPDGKKGTMRIITNLTEKDKHICEMYYTGPDGKEFKNMEMIYVRKQVK